MGCEEIDYIDSDETLHFTTGITAENKEDEDISFPTNWGLNSINMVEIRSVSLQSKENLDWDVIFWSKSSTDDTTLTTDAYVTKLNFPAASSKQINSTNQYYYEINNLKIDYCDKNHTSKLHCSLVNRSLASKTSGTNGQVKLRVAAMPIV